MEEQSQTFRDLVAWQRAMDLAPQVYKVIRSFPDVERFSLCDQIRRATISISTNIAEGQGRNNPKEFAHFLGIARGSLSELESLLILANRLEYLSAAQLNSLCEKLHAIRRPLNGLIEKFRAETAPLRKPRSTYRLPSTRMSRSPEPSKE